MGSSTAVDATAKTFLFRKKIKKIAKLFPYCQIAFPATGYERVQEIQEEE